MQSKNYLLSFSQKTQMFSAGRVRRLAQGQIISILYRSFAKSRNLHTSLKAGALVGRGAGPVFLQRLLSV